MIPFGHGVRKDSGKDAKELQPRMVVSSFSICSVKQWIQTPEHRIKGRPGI